MKKEVNICDNCKERVTKLKCCLCNNDVCSNCSEKEILGLFDGLVCNSCNEKLNNCGIEEEDFWKDFIKNNKDIKEKIMDYIKRNIIIENLSETKKKKDDKYGYSKKLVDLIERQKLFKKNYAKRILKDGTKKRAI